jgi:hypothetical protein
MIDAKIAVAHALRFLAEMFGDDNVIRPRLEEVALSEDGRVWNVTLSFVMPPPDTPPLYTPSQLADMISSSAAGEEAYYVRVYKAFEISADTGDVRSMKIRQLT